MTREYKLGETCAHDHLARQCPLCERDDELDELRAYRDKTEAGLLSLSMAYADENCDFPPLRGDLKELGLWREPPKDGGA